MRKFLLLTLFSLLISGSYAQAGPVKFSTYYPAPFGVYDRLRLVPRATLSAPCDTGSIYVDNSTNTLTLRFCDANMHWVPAAPEYWTKSGTNLYPTDISATANVGIGTTTPAGRLAIKGAGTGTGDALLISDSANTIRLRVRDNGQVLVGSSFAPDNGEVFKVIGSNAYDLLKLQNTNVNGSSSIIFYDNNGTFRGQVGYTNAGAGNFASKMVLDSGVGNDIMVNTDDNFAGVYSERMRIKSVTGNVGIGTTTPEFRLSVDTDGGIMAKGTYGSGTAPTTAGAGTRLMWYPKKAAFRAGGISGTQWDDSNIGNYSVAMGYNTQATLDGSIALGYGTSAMAAHAVALGKDTTAYGTDSTAMGQSTVASGLESTAMGISTTASGDASLATGKSTLASGKNSVAMGYFTTAQAYASLVIGQYNVITGTTYQWITTDPLFVIGNGASVAAPANALTVLKNGNVGIGTAAPTEKLEVTGGNIKAANGLIIETRTTDNPSGVNGQFWLCTDTGDAVPCNGI